MSPVENTPGKLESPGLVFACAGAADVGAIADQAARKLGKDKELALCCIAAIAAGVPEIIEKAKNAPFILAVDGCKHQCTKKVLEQAGIADFHHLELETMGLKKGESPETPETVDGVAAQGRAICQL